MLVRCLALREKHLFRRADYYWGPLRPEQFPLAPRPVVVGDMTTDIDVCRLQLQAQQLPDVATAKARQRSESVASSERSTSPMAEAEALSASGGGDGPPGSSAPLNPAPAFGDSTMATAAPPPAVPPARDDTSAGPMSLSASPRVLPQKPAVLESLFYRRR